MTHKPISVLRRLIQAMTLAVGFGTLWFVVANVVGEGLVDVWTKSPEWPPRENLAVRADGTPLIASTQRGQLNASYKELNGRAVSDPENLRLVDPFWMAIQPRRSEFDFLTVQSGWEKRLKLFTDDQDKSLKWFFVHDGGIDGTGYFVGYDPVDKRTVGYIGQAGFTSRPVALSDRFPVRFDLMRLVPYWSAVKIQIFGGKLLDQGLLPTPIPARLVSVPAQNRLYEVDLSARTVRQVFESPEMIESFTALLESPSITGGPTSRGPIQALRTTGHLYLLNREHQVLRKFSIPTETDCRFPVAVYELFDGEAFAAFDRWRVCDDNRNIDPKILYRIAADGTLADQTELILESGMLKWHKQRAATVFHCALPVPIALALVEPFMITFIDQENSYASAARSMFRNSWPSLVGLLILSLLLAAAAWRRARGFALPASEQLAWVIFVFLGGLPGYVGFWLHRRWPLRQNCPRCRTRVAWDREVCAACGKPFPSAAVQGIEILCA